jgi:cyclase
MLKSLSLLTLLVFCLSSQAQEFTDIDTMMTARGVNFDDIIITTQEVAPGMHVLFGSGGNILASIGEQGTLLVDSQFAQLYEKNQRKLRELGSTGVTFTINSHFHFDHAFGNPLLVEDGAWIITHANARRSMAGEHLIDLVGSSYRQPPYPKDALPVFTYDDHMQLHFNDETIDLMHFGPAHTTGDTAIYFRNANIIHMGDVFNASYPFIDAGNGGDIDGMIEFCKSVLDAIETDTAVLPGHGPVLAYQDLADYINMLETVRDRIGRLLDAGSTLEEVFAASPTREFDDRYGDPTRLIDRAYMSLSR